MALPPAVVPVTPGILRRSALPLAAGAAVPAFELLCFFAPPGETLVGRLGVERRVGRLGVEAVLRRSGAASGAGDVGEGREKREEEAFILRIIFKDWFV